MHAITYYALLHYSVENEHNVSLSFSMYPAKTCLWSLMINGCNITLLRCPRGFHYHNESHGCTCSHVILNILHFNCLLSDNKGFLNWNGTVWVGHKVRERYSRNGFLLSQSCPINHCKSGEKMIDLDANPDSQCDFNHFGVLCGGCKENFSLAIGSSNCIECSTDWHLALFIFFLAADLLLVSFIFIFDLTVSKGLINGLVFYANILWSYKSMLLSSKQQKLVPFLEIFIAWINLNFGIETCFVDGLNAFWKTWLQFLFPMYLWIIAGVIIIACRYSSRLTRLVGDRAVPLLATLFYLSYMKILHTVLTVLGLAVLIHYPDGSNLVVWAEDGNLSYCQHPHIYLLSQL